MAILNNFQSVKAIFVWFNSVLPSSAAVEHLFSFAGIITRPCTQTLSNQIKSNQIFFCSRRCKI